MIGARHHDLPVRPRKAMKSLHELEPTWGGDYRTERMAAGQGIQRAGASCRARRRRRARGCRSGGEQRRLRGRQRHRAGRRRRPGRQRGARRMSQDRPRHRPRSRSRSCRGRSCCSSSRSALRAGRALFGRGRQPASPGHSRRARASSCSSAWRSCCRACPRASGRCRLPDVRRDPADADRRRAAGRGRGRQPALARPRHHPAPAVRADEAIDRADLARFYEILPASEIRKFGAIWPAAVLIGLPAALVMLQPDLGTALMITGGGVAVMFLAGIPLRLFIGGALALAVSAIPLASISCSTIISATACCLHDPESDPLGTGYHISQSKIAIGSGGIFRQGLPQRHPEPSRLSARGPYRFRAGDDDGGMGADGRRVPDHRLRLPDRLGDRRQHARQEPLRPADRRGPLRDDLLLRRRSTWRW
jgi:hypothetical protein